MSILNLEIMKTSEKFIIMEEICDGLSKNIGTHELTPQWHKYVLDTREERVQKKQAKFYNSEDVKKDLSDIVL